ncbi:MAG TPA: YdeI/OmpD-associated family protein [Jatrophihabitans sp.]|nr:YdeI/OmpD-associated family protein [Jatrophihabitans sp.]
MAPQRFTAVLEAGPGGGAFVVLPDDVLAALGGGTRFRVRGSIGDVAFESSTMAMGGGRVCVGVHKATRQAAAVDIGDEVVVDLERDVRPRTLEIPADLAAALADDPDARAAFDRLSFTHRREHVEALTGAKRAQTRERRLAKTLDQLRGVQ